MGSKRKHRHSVPRAVFCPACRRRRCVLIFLPPQHGHHGTAPQPRTRVAPAPHLGVHRCVDPQRRGRLLLHARRHGRAHDAGQRGGGGVVRVAQGHAARWGTGEGDGKSCQGGACEQQRNELGRRARNASATIPSDACQMTAINTGCCCRQPPQRHAWQAHVACTPVDSCTTQAAPLHQQHSCARSPPVPPT